jgi:hypothetical protein
LILGLPNGPDDCQPDGFGVLAMMDDGESSLRSLDVHHRLLGYETNRIKDSSEIQRLDAAGNDTSHWKDKKAELLDSNGPWLPKPDQVI